jgi:plastocyanin
MSQSTNSRVAGALRVGSIVGTSAALVLIAIVASGCSTASEPARQTARTTSTAGRATASATTVSDVQTCAACTGKKGMPPKTTGSAVISNGTQVIDVQLAGGYYSPNTFTVKAGAPVRVVFGGKAKGCLAKPKIASLNKQVDFTSTGSATMDLGSLKPGVYTFTCGMGMNAGTITVR